MTWMSRVFLSLCIITLPAIDVSAKPRFAHKGKVSEKPYEFPKNQDEAAAIHVSIIGSVPLEEITASLTTKFAISDEKALAEVIPTTRFEEEQSRQATRTEIKTALPTESFSSTETVKQEGDSPANKTSTKETTKASGDASSLNAPDAIKTSANEIPALITGKNAQVDPMLKYQSAAQLKRGVALLDRIVMDPPIPDGYSAHVVTFQIALFPYHRGIPIDAYSTISVFSRSSNSVVQSWRMRQILEDDVLKPLSYNDDQKSLFASTISSDLNEELAKGKQLINFSHSDITTVIDNGLAVVNESVAPGVKLHKKQRQALADNALIAVKEQAIQEITENNPMILPLLVTDTLEISSEAKSATVQNALALAISAQLKGVAAGISSEKVLERINRLLGNDLNAILTVGKVAPNVFSVRLGAMNQGADRWAMVPRTHNVYMLLLVPDTDFDSKNKAEMSILSKTELRNLDTGAPLEDRDNKKVTKLVAQIIGKYSKDKNLFKGQEDKLISSILNNNRKGFLGYLEESPGKKLLLPYHEQIWTDLATVLAGSQYSSSRFTVRKSAVPTILSSANAGLTFVDSGKAMTVLLRGGDKLNANTLTALLEIQGTNKGTAVSLVLPASSVQILAGNTMAQLTFPSLGDVAPYQFVLTTINPSATFTAQASAYLASKTPPKTSTPGLIVPSTFVRFDNKGMATLSVEITGVAAGQDSCRIRVNGADAVLAPTSPAGAMDSNLAVKADGKAALSLSNVSQLSPITIQLYTTDKNTPVGAPIVCYADPLPVPGE